MSVQLKDLSDENYLISFLENYYAFAHTYPDLPLLLEKFSYSDDELRQTLLSIGQKLEKRGLPTYESKVPLFKEDERAKKASRVKDFADHLDPRFILACNVLLDTGNTKSMSAKFKELAPMGVTTKMWSNWLKEPKYQQYASQVFDEKFDFETELAAKSSLIRNIHSGDLQSIKYYYELTNKFRPMSENQLAIATIIQVVIEIMSKHMAPDVIDTVAEELDNSPVGELLRGIN